MSTGNLIEIVESLRAEVASLKEELDEAYMSRNGWKWKAEKWLGDVNDLTQQLAAANGRVEVLRGALLSAREVLDGEGCYPKTVAKCDAALSNLNEDSAG
jgi:predicted RNase H-like nuclease (RuvC/YqgF family)